MTAPRRLSTAVFDVGQVLFRWDRALLYPDLSDAERERALSEVVPLDWHARHDAGEPIDALVAERVAERPADAALIERHRDRFTDSLPGPVDGVHELVERLHARGVPLYIISNFGADTWAKFAPDQPIFDRFRDRLISGIEKLVKPDPAIFALAIERFGIDPADALFVDDSQPNVAAAAKAGFTGHLFTDAPRLETALVAHGLLPG